MAGYKEIGSYGKNLLNWLKGIQNWPANELASEWQKIQPNLDWLRTQGITGVGWADYLEKKFKPENVPSIEEPYQGHNWYPSTPVNTWTLPNGGEWTDNPEVPAIMPDEPVNLTITPTTNVADYARQVRDWAREHAAWPADQRQKALDALAPNIAWLRKQGKTGIDWADWLEGTLFPQVLANEGPNIIPPGATPWVKPTPPLEGWTDNPALPPTETVPKPITTPTTGISNYPRPPQSNIPNPEIEYPTPGRPRKEFENIYAWRKPKPLWW